MFRARAEPLLSLREVTIGRWRSDCNESRVAVTTGSCRAALGMDGRGRPSLHKFFIKFSLPGKAAPYSSG